MCWRKGYYNRKKKAKSFKEVKHYGTQNMDCMKTLYRLSTTFENKEDAMRLASILLEEKLIACGQISGPITSVYRWKGRTEIAEEFVLHLKTAGHLIEELQRAVLEGHPYDLPEIVMEKIESSEEYLNWVYREVQ